MSLRKNGKASELSLLERIVRPVSALALAIGVFGLSNACMPNLNHSIKPSPSSVCAEKHGGYTQKYCTNAHERLDMEKDFIEEDSRAAEEYFAFLDLSVIDGVRKKVGNRARLAGWSNLEKCGKHSAREIMKTIDNFFEDEGFTRTESDVPLLSQALKAKTFDCDTGVFVYLALAEVMDIPLVAVREPGNEIGEEHIYLRWRFSKKEYLEWEPLKGEKKLLSNRKRRINDFYIRNRFKGSVKTAIKNGVYLADLKPQEIIAMHYTFVGKAWREKGNLEKAVEHLDKAYSLNPGDHVISTNRGITYIKKGNFDAAIENFNAAIRSHPGYSQAYLNRGIAWFRKGDINKAIENLNISIDLNPDDFIAFTNRGFIYMKMGHLDKALEDFDVSKDLEPNDFHAYFLSGIAWYKKGDYQKAIENLNKARELNPNYRPALKIMDAIQKKKHEMQGKERQKSMKLTKAYR
ncbi:tetratricopeptide repeat protein [Candidatus Woesearchaeota archaeon]|nr:tetratricopeptide repeat protein [Candidatus Woesearchaeota archaeon]